MYNLQVHKSTHFVNYKDLQLNNWLFKKKLLDFFGLAISDFVFPTHCVA